MQKTCLRTTPSFPQTYQRTKKCWRRRLFPFLVCPDTGPILRSLLERNNLVESHWNNMRKGFLDHLLDWEVSSACWKAERFSGRIGDLERGKEGLIRALELLAIGQNTIARRIDRSIAKKQFAPLCDLLKGLNPTRPDPPTLRADIIEAMSVNDGIQRPSWLRKRSEADERSNLKGFLSNEKKIFYKQLYSRSCFVSTNGRGAL